MPEIVTTEKPLNFVEACQFLGVSKSTLYKWTSSHLIPHSKPGGKLLFFNRTHLVKWMLQNQVKA